MQEMWVQSLSQEDNPGEGIGYVGDLGLIPGVVRCPGGGHCNPLQYSCLENPHGQKGLAGYNPWGLKESDTTEQLSKAQHMVVLFLVFSFF